MQRADRRRSRVNATLVPRVVASAVALGDVPSAAATNQTDPRRFRGQRVRRLPTPYLHVVAAAESLRGSTNQLASLNRALVLGVLSEMLSIADRAERAAQPLLLVVGTAELTRLLRARALRESAGLRVRGRNLVHVA